MARFLGRYWTDFVQGHACQRGHLRGVSIKLCLMFEDDNFANTTIQGRIDNAGTGMMRIVRVDRAA